MYGGKCIEKDQDEESSNVYILTKVPTPPQSPFDRRYRRCPTQPRMHNSAPPQVAELLPPELHRTFAGRVFSLDFISSHLASDICSGHRWILTIDKDAPEIKGVVSRSRRCGEGCCKTRVTHCNSCMLHPQWLVSYAKTKPGFQVYCQASSLG